MFKKLMFKNRKSLQTVIQPDSIYNSRLVTLFIIKILQAGKKSLAQRIIYKSLDIISTKVKKNPILILEQAIKNVTPDFTITSKRIRGSNFQVPSSVGAFQGVNFAIKWIIEAARSSRSKEKMANKIAHEILEAAKGNGNAIRKKDQTHKMADANKAFTYYRY